jgi:hypothetical protein
VKGFKILRGVKQGDALSCILFIMCMEPLSRNIEVNENITPLVSENLQSRLPKSYTYADDLNGCIKNTRKALQELFNEYSRLTDISGLELNADKTEIIRLHGQETRVEAEYRISYRGKVYNLKSQPMAKINGLFLQQSYERMVDDNVDKAIQRIDKIFKSWSRRGLSTLGKILIVKTFAISQLIHVIQALALNESHFKRINNVLYKFIWNRHYLAAKAPERIKREIVNKPIKLGGLGMLDIAELDQSLKIKALGRLLVTEHPMLTLIRRKLDMSQFLYPRINTFAEKPTCLAVKYISSDRIKLLTDPNAISDRRFMGLIHDMSIMSALNPRGRYSIAFLVIRNHGKRRLGELNRQELDNLSTFLNSDLVSFLSRTIDSNVIVPDATDKQVIYINFKPKQLNTVTSKEIRLSRSNREPLCLFKTGAILAPNESVNYFFTVNRLTSIKHKNVILKILHGDVYTKERQFNFHLTDSPNCPRCDEIETIEHKFATCNYVSRIWRCADALTNKIPDQVNNSRRNSI